MAQENINQNQLEKGAKITAYEHYTEYYPSLKNELEIEKVKEQNRLDIEKVKEELSCSVSPDVVSKGSLSSGGVIEIDVPNLKQNNQIAFYGKISQLGTLTIGHGLTQPYASAFIEINSTTIKVYSYGSAKVVKEELTHGLTIKDFITVIIRVQGDRTAKLIVNTTGATYSKSIVWNGGGGSVTASMSGGTLTNCQLSFYCEDYKKPIWAYGDSYFDYWVKTVNDIGVGNWLVDGYSGRRSVEALASLKKGLNKATPQIILWCLGMNDGDSASAVNANWKNTIEELKEICTTNNITLILSTIPNTPTIRNTFKNDYVRGSGYRYVDVAQAVGADSEASYWYEGLLNTDNVHPSEKGKNVIAYRFLADVPELLDNK